MSDASDTEKSHVSETGRVSVPDAPDIVLTDVRPPHLSADESSFAMAVVEFGGNLGAAYRAVFGDCNNPIKRAQEMICRPEIAIQIKKIHEAMGENALISLGSHLIALANIRDQSIELQDMKTALSAEVKRGEVGGFYKDKTTDASKRSAVTINVLNATPTNAQDWARQFGNAAPVIIENAA